MVWAWIVVLMVLNEVKVQTTSVKHRVLMRQESASETQAVYHFNTHAQGDETYTQFVRQRNFETRNDEETSRFQSSSNIEHPVSDRFELPEEYDKIRVATTSRSTRAYYPPLDLFRCSACMCYEVKQDMVHADCKRHHRRRATIESIPETLPLNINQVDMDSNAMKYFDTNVLSRYKSLMTANAPGNQITGLYRVHCTSTVIVQHLDLSYNMISSLEDGALSCMPNLRALFLRGNHIQVITNGTLAGLYNLQRLYLACNEITHIESGAFLDPRGLQVLDLRRNKKLALSRKYVETFRPLEKLEVFHIQGCASMSGKYPTDVLSVLLALKELGVNGEVHPFDSKLSVLQNLTRLELGITDFCFTKNFTKSYFNALAHLTSIKIEGCRIDDSSSYLFEMNHRIVDLRLKHDKKDVKNLFSMLCHLRHLDKVRHLAITYTQKHSQLCPLVSLSRQEAHCISRMKNLHTLILDFSAISQVSREFADGMPKSVKKLSLKGNFLISSQSVLYLLKTRPKVLPNLEYLFEDGQGDTFSLKDITADKYNQRKIYEEKIHTNISSKSIATNKVFDMNSVEAQANLLTIREYFGRVSDYTKEKSSPDNPSEIRRLKVYTASDAINLGTPVFKGNIQIGILNLSNTLVRNWGERPIQKIPRETIIADLSDNRCEGFQQSFFHVNNSLIELHAQGNFLSGMLSKDRHGSKLSPLNNLEYLDLSRNHLFFLPWLLFQSVPRLHVLKLDSNNLESFDIRVKHMKSLIFVGLAKNSISSITERTRKELDELSKSQTIFFDLTYNPLPCSCEGLGLLRWMSLTQVKFLKKDFLQCKDGDSPLELVGDLSKRVEALQRQCVSKKVLIVVASFSIVLLLLLAGFVWVFQKRWWILYMWNLTVSKCYGYKTSENPGNSSAPGYTFDAFFVYSCSSSDFVLDECLEELEVNRSHRLCVEDRDFLPGSYVPCNITSAVRSSKTTVVVLDQNFRSVGWTHYAVEMAQVEAIRSRRNVLHLLFVGSSPDGPLSSPYLKLLKQGKFSEVPPRECPPDVREKFWNRFSRILGHGDRRDSRPSPPLVLCD
ncbi:hypothetical protein RRG08_046133 [Elysia crispata]|uniref:TIR domain-containing protein n=1 Tax=Elysia crispata TaxID=231223 RepID=A0AAE1A410_9GAST|nr:hypothetical protein RRG08_046133 [Elysia crispata]